MEINLYLTYVLSSLIFIAAPGPSIALVIAHGIWPSATKQYSLLGGILLADGILMALAGMGIGLATSVIPNGFVILKQIAAAYLIFLGVKHLRKTKSFILQKNDHANSSPSSRGLFLQGFSSSISNPATISFFSAYFPMYIQIKRNMPFQLTILIITFLILAAIVLYLYLLFSKKIGSFFLQDKQLNQISGVLMSLLLLGMGVYMFIQNFMVSS